MNEKLKLHCHIAELEMENIALRQAGEKLIGILTNIRHEIDYLPDTYYEWMNQVIHETEELFSKEV